MYYTVCTLYKLGRESVGILKFDCFGVAILARVLGFANKSYTLIWYDGFDFLGEHLIVGKYMEKV